MLGTSHISSTIMRSNQACLGCQTMQYASMQSLPSSHPVLSFPFEIQRCDLLQHAGHRGGQGTGLPRARAQAVGSQIKVCCSTQLQPGGCEESIILRH